jgi:hypothetical protein
MKKRSLFALPVLLFLGCTSTSDKGDVSATKVQLSPQTTWYWQLYTDETHPLRTDIPAQLYDVDLFDTSSRTIAELKGEEKVVICYFSAGTYESWRPDSALFPSDALGNPLQEWSEERWVDITDPRIRSIMAMRLELAKEKGCDGVEPDNVDGYSHDTGFSFSYDDQIEYNLFLARQAHEKGLLIGLKNDLMQVDDLVDHFDFAINEECHQYLECFYLEPFTERKKPVFNAEYSEIYLTDSEAFEELCEEARKENLRTLVLPRQLDGSFVKSCDHGEY